MALVPGRTVKGVPQSGHRFCYRFAHVFGHPLVSGPAGGFNKAKVDHGGPAVGNRYVIIRYEDEAAYDKFYNGGGKEWIDKHAPEAREIKVEGVEPK